MGHRQAVEDPDRTTACEDLVRASRVGHRSIGHERHNRVHFRVDTLDLSQVCCHHFTGRDLLLSDSCGQLRRADEQDLLGRRL